MFLVQTDTCIKVYRDIKRLISRNKILETKYWNAERFELDGEEMELNVARERRIECKMLKELIFRSEDFKEMELHDT